MARNDVVCPICSADIPLSGDERNGDEIYCTVCSAPCKLSGDPASDDCEAEEDDM